MNNIKDLIPLVRPYLRQYLVEQGVEIVKKGTTEFFSCISPDHEDSDPSAGFVKNTDDEQFHCFGCGISGDILSAAALLENKPLYGVAFVKDNLEYLLNKYGVKHEISWTEDQLNNLKIESVYQEASKLLVRANSLGQLIFSSLDEAIKRGWSAEICRKLGIATVNNFDDFIQSLSKTTQISRDELETLGIKSDLFGPDYITISIKDHKGLVVGFVARYLKWKKGCDIPKYKNTSSLQNPAYQKEQILFCLDIAKKYNSLRLDIFEGYGSAIVAHQNSYHNAVALGSTAFTDAHLNLILELGFQHINFVLDSDSTGYDMMEKYMERLGGHPKLGVTLTHLPISEEDKKVPGQNDPDFYIRTYGIDEYRKLKPEGMFEHMLDKHISALNITENPIFTKNFARQIIPLIINQPDMIERGIMINRLAAITCIEKEDIKNEIRRLETTDIRLVKDELARKIRTTNNPDDLKDLLIKSIDNISDTGATKNDRYLASVGESIEVFDSIFAEMNTLPEGIHGWKTDYPELDKLLDGIPKPTKGGTAIGFAGAPQHSKLLANDTLVPTPTGFKKHGDLKVGDKIFGRDGKSIKVLQVHPKSFANKLVRFSDGTEILCNEDHLWVVRNHHNIEKTIDTKTIANSLYQKSGRPEWSVDPTPILYNSEKKYKLDPYVLGAWLGDGRSTASDLSHSPKDIEHIEKIKSLGFSRTTQWIHKTTGVVYTSFTGLVSKIRSLGLYNNKHIPEQYFHGSVKQRLELLAGLIDTDGYVYHKNGRFTFTNSNFRLLKDVERLIRSLGSRTTLSLAKKYPPDQKWKIETKQDSYQLTFNIDLEVPCALPRKKRSPLPYLKRNRTIIAIENIDPVEGNCITVEGGVYLVGETLIPTHNSAIMLNLALSLARNNDDISICYWAIDDHRKIIAYRLISMLSGVPMRKVRNTDKRSPADEHAIKVAQELLRDLVATRKLVFKDDKYGRSKSKAEAWIKETQDATGNGILFCVDSLHNVQGDSGSETRVKILTTSMWLKSLCASIPATIMASIELVKNKTKGEKPTLMSISESGKAEYDFDTLAIVWNQAQGCYLPVEAVQAKWGIPGNYKPVIELDFQKNKAGAGEKGSLFLKFDTDTTAFVDCMSYSQYMGTRGPSTIVGSGGTVYKFGSPTTSEPPIPLDDSKTAGPLDLSGW